MGPVGDDDDVVEVVFAGDGGEAVDLLLGVDGVGLGDDVGEGDSVGEEIVAAYAALGVSGVVVAASAEGDDERGDLLAVEIDGVVEAGVEDGRGVGRSTRPLRRRRWRRRAGRRRRLATASIWR